jgi:predicted mannosyl-3-phosphoglycerate phosphatase (HAD superfamily)
MENINTNYSISEMEVMKQTIEVLSKPHHIAILKIIKSYPNVMINENKSGVYINLTFLPKEAYSDIIEYLSYIEGQENMLEIVEKEKTLIKTQIEFNDENSCKKEDKDNFSNIYSYIC